MTRVDADEPEEIGRWSFVGEIEIPIDAPKIGPGGYLSTIASADGTPRRNMQFSLCTSDNPRPSGRVDERNGEVLPAEVSAESRPDPADLDLDAEDIAEWRALPVPAAQHWNRGRVAPTKQRPIAAVDEKSCAITLAHRMDLVQISKTWDRGTCSGCGRVKFYKRWLPNEPAPKVQSPVVPPQTRRSSLLGTVPSESPIAGAEILDALVWMGSGTAAEAENVIRQAADSALAVDNVLRALESVGHIDLLRSYESGAVSGWRIARRQLLELADGSWLAVGSWDIASLVLLEAEAPRHGARLVHDDDDWIPRRALSKVERDAAAVIAGVCDATLVTDGARRTLASLAPILDVVAALPRCSVAGLRELEVFSARAASWIASEGIASVGAFRTSGFSRRHLFVGHQDLSPSTAAVGSVYLVKHAGAAAQGTTLLSYDGDTRTLVVPLGADLPGLYGRALAQCAGRPASGADRAAVQQYRDVPSDVAAKIAQLMRSA